MNELKRYEELIQQQLTDLPLPDEDLAWKEMKKLLDEDDDDAIIVPPVRRGCGLWTLLPLLILIAIGWYFLRPDKWIRSDRTTKVETTDTLAQRSLRNRNNPGENRTTGFSDSVEQNVPGTTSDSSLNKQQTISTTESTVTNIQTNTSKTTSVNPKPSQTSKSGNTKPGNKPQKQSAKSKPELVSSDLAGVTVTGASRSNNSLPPDKETTTTNSNTITTQEKITDTANRKTDTANRKTDTATIQRPKSDSANAKGDSISTKQTRQKPPKTYSWGAGLGMNQQIPFAGQSAVPYNAAGRKGSLADYIPSVYIRFYQDNHWFAEAEFRYGAPQYTDEITYDVKKNNSGTVDTSLTLQKTYYHQLPLNFNYYVLPGFSVGAGVVWNKFKSAVSQKSVSARSPVGGSDTLLSQEIVKSNASSSVFSKSFWQFQVQTQYTWKRLMIGLKYSRGLEPFIVYPSAAGRQEEKNQALQLYLRYELWRSKSK